MNTRHPTLRQATDADSELVYQIKREAFRPYVELTWGAWDEQFQRERHRENFNPATIQIIVVDGQVIGWLGVEYSASAVWIANIHLVPNWQGRGIGTTLLREILEVAATRRVPVSLRVLKSNPRARALYERLGLVVVSETDTHFNMETRPA